jgi:hypothetical protein
VVREYDDDHYDDENIRLYTPVLQRVITLAAVIIAVPVMMWTITTFVRSYVARPKVPALEQVASTNMPARISAIVSPPPGPVSSDQSAPAPVEATSASTAKGAETRNGPPNLTSLPDASAPPAAATSPTDASVQAMQPPSSAIAAAATADISTTGGSAALPAPSVPRPPLAPRSNDNTASTGTQNSSDRGLAWPNPNATSPPDFGAPRLSSPSTPAHTAAAEVLPADEPIRGPIPLPRQRPGTFATSASLAASGPVGGAVPLPRIRPSEAPAETAKPVIETPYRGGLSDY